MVVVDVDENYEEDSASNLANRVCALRGELPGFVGVSHVRSLEGPGGCMLSQTNASVLLQNIY